MRTCNHCGDTFPDFDVAHVCSKGQYAPKLPTPNLRKAAQELLKEYDAQRFVSIFHTQIEALRVALAAPEQEPVVYWDGDRSVIPADDVSYFPNWTDYYPTPLYRHPAPEQEPVADRTAWLVELVAGPFAPAWLSAATVENGWTKDANAAISFPSKETALDVFERLMTTPRWKSLGLGRSCYKITEHMFVNPTQSCPPDAQSAQPTDCTRIMREQGKPYPRTCPRCKLGPCAY